MSQTHEMPVASKGEWVYNGALFHPSQLISGEQIREQYTDLVI